MYNKKIIPSEPITLANFINLCQLRTKQKDDTDYTEHYTCISVNYIPLTDPLKDPITKEDLVDPETGDPVYPCVLDDENWEIVLSNNLSVGTLSLKDLIRDHGDKTIVESHTTTDENNITKFHLVIKAI
jgi:hypothetical protein